MNCILNGTVFREHEVCLSPFCEGFMYGKGVFETLKVKENKICFWEQHWQRLQEGCRKLNFQLAVKEEVIKEQCLRLIAMNAVQADILKINIFAGAQKTEYLLTMRKNDLKKTDYERGFSLRIESPFYADPKLASLKSMNYLPYFLAKEKAKKMGFQESLLVTPEKLVLEGSFTNIFWFQGEKFYTPASFLPILPGVQRKMVIANLQANSFMVREGEFFLDELLQAEGAFLTNSILEMMPVKNIGEMFFDLSRCRNLMAKICF